MEGFQTYNTSTLLPDITNPHHLAFNISYAHEQSNQYDEPHEPTFLVTTSISCLKDDENFLLSDGMHSLSRLKFIWLVVWSCTQNVDITLQTWLELLEGNTGDDVWLWVDGDEKEAEERCSMNWWSTPTDGQWRRAVSALSDRYKRKGNQEESAHLAERRQRVQEADPAMRFLMIAWLIVTSKAVRAADASRGLNNREIWDLNALMGIWASVVCHIKPSAQAISDNVFQTFCNTLTATGHTCHRSNGEWDWRCLQQWICMRSLLHPLKRNEVVCLSLKMVSLCPGYAARYVRLEHSRVPTHF